MESRRGPATAALTHARRTVDDALSRDRGRLLGLWSRWNAKPAHAEAQAAFATALEASIAARQARAARLPAAPVAEGLPIAAHAERIVELVRGHQVLVVAGGSLAGLPLPLLPLQILWLNLVTDTLPALSLAVEPGETDVMERPPRAPEAAILSAPFVRSLLFYAGLITAVTLAAFLWGLRTGPEARAVTLAFFTLALAQLFHLGTARARGGVMRPAQAFANPWALAALAVVIPLQFLALYWPPLAAVLGTVPLSARDALLAGGLAVVPAVVGQLVRLRRRPPIPQSGSRI